MTKTELKLLDDGPILVAGEWTLVDAHGKTLQASEGKPLALCRCGASKTKPLCDGAHKAVDFKTAKSGSCCGCG